MENFIEKYKTERYYKTYTNNNNPNNMKHAILDSCLVSSNQQQQHQHNNHKWYRLKPQTVTKQELESYAKYRKTIMSNYKKKPKSLNFRLKNICPNCNYLICSCKKNKFEKKFNKHCKNKKNIKIIFFL